MATAGLQSVAVLESEGGGRQNGEERQASRPAAIVQMWRELEDERLAQSSSPRTLHQRVDSPGRLNPEDREWSQSPADSDTGQDDASDLGELERERVRQIFREWRSTGSRERTSSARGTREWLGEMEQERVRVIREYVHQTSQQRDPNAAGRIERVLDELGHGTDGGSTESTSRRTIRRLCGRQALLDMVRKAERERQLEIQSLSQHRAVSQFAHRIRIQSVLRGRFLRNGSSIEDGSRRRPDFRQRRSPLSDLESESRTRAEIQIEPQTRTETQTEPQTMVETSDSLPTHQRTDELEDRTEPESLDSTVSDQGIGELEPETRPEALHSLEEHQPQSSRSESARVDSYFPMPGDGGQTELRDISDMGTVSRLLTSEFRRDLDEVLQSYIQRQNDNAEEESSDVENDVADDNDPRPQATEEQTSEEPLWDNDSSFIIPPSFGNEWDMMNDLRIDMARLHRRMSSMQRMLEACMDMQIELQRSIKQEISFALKSSACPPENDAKWDDVRRGLCCVCRRNTIDSLLYRCGHLCTCVKCADELLRDSGKCPMCCAPVAEVIRAYAL